MNVRMCKNELSRSAVNEYRNVGEFHSNIGRKLENSQISIFWKENTPFGNSKLKEELLRNG